VLSDRWRCLRADAYGCGSSPPPPPGLTLDDVASGIVAALDDRGVGEVALVGLSMGGYTAMAMLRSAPERVRALVLADTRDGADTDGARADRLEMARRVRAGGVEPIVEPMVQRLLSSAGRDEAHIVDPLRSRIRHCTPEGIAACQEAMAARPDSSDVLAGVRVPALVVCGADDTVTAPEEMRAMAARIPGARFSLVADAGHLANLEQPAAFGELLAGFLDEAYPPAR